MNRDDGFAIADVATDLYADPKVKALARRLRDPVQTAVHMMLYEALRLASWGEGQRVTLEEAAPAWWPDPVDDIAGNLIAVELIGEDTRLPEHSWARWFGPAFDRREARRASGAKGGRTGGKGRPKPDPSDDQATPNPSGPTGPDRPSDPSVSTESTPVAPASGGTSGRRANGTNPRATASALAEAKSYRRSQRQHAYNRGAITEAQQADMNRRDAPLTEIIDYRTHTAALAAEVIQ